jgi:hypothetical protein
MTSSSNEVLLYRATKDGFTGEAFHQKCDGKANTVTIIKTDGDYVFGGYTAAEWNSDGNKIEDSNAFIFSLRRNGVSQSDKFLVYKTNEAIFGYSGYGPTFGLRDFIIKNRSDINKGSFSWFCSSYQCPPGYSRGYYTRSFLAGSEDDWLTTEIEVYQITNFY